ncbi:MAG: phage minor head protein [Bauldia sp.]
MPEPAAFAVNPVEAIDFLRRKVRVPTQRWTDVWQGMHSAAFVVAGAESDALLADFHEAVNRNIAEGRTLEQFRADFDRIVAAHGWSYRGSRNWRSRMIFQTNLRTAYSAGRWAQIQRLKATRPYLRYVAVMDERTRPLHRHWHDTVLSVDDPWWATHFPPNGWNCRCSVQQLSERDLTRYGLKVSERAPDSPLVAREINTRSGKVTVQVPEGIDPGFAYNPGIAGFGNGAQGLAMERHGAWAPLDAPGAGEERLPPLPIDRSTAPPIRGAGDSEDALRAMLRQAIGGDEAVLTDPAAGRVRVSQAIVDHLLADAGRRDGRERYFGLIPGIVEDPAEIWIGWAIDVITGRVGLRRRYVKLVDIGGGRIVGLVADADGGEWSGLTFFRGRADGALRLRSGRLIYRR